MEDTDVTALDSTVFQDFFGSRTFQQACYLLILIVKRHVFSCTLLMFFMYLFLNYEMEHKKKPVLRLKLTKILDLSSITNNLLRCIAPKRRLPPYTASR